MMKWKLFIGGVLFWVLHLIISVMSGISTGPESVLFSCDFETDFCGMVQLTDDDFDWTRHSGPTPTYGTGPSSAYSGSYFMYMEATDHVDQDARIAITNLNYQGVVCMTFAYHMFGKDPGRLIARTKLSGVVGWDKQGNRGNQWREATTEFDLRAGERLEFYGIVGKDSAGDMAVDDVIVRSGSCKRQVDLPYFCSFESGFGGMTQSNDDHFDWTRDYRRADSFDTGPSQAYDGSWFLVIDEYQWPTNFAGMETPAFSHSGPVCIRFHYHMFGKHVGELTVMLVNLHGKQRTIFTKSGSQDDQWLTAEITAADFQQGTWIEFDASRELFASGNIAIDKVFISTDECNACQVNNGDCQHTCHKTTQGGRTCTCDDGFQLSEDSDTACIDVDECAINNGNCLHRCSNTHGSFTCHCNSGYTLAPDGHNCIDIDECSTENQCVQRCQNIPGGYRCSCDDTNILATDGHHCIDCRAAYRKKFDASQAFSSDCPTMRLLSDVTLDSCLLEACNENDSVVAFVNNACALKDCTGNDIKLVTVAGNTGWDIYVQNVTWQQELPRGFPLPKLLVGVILGAVVLVAVNIGVTLCLRTKIISTT